MFYCTTIPKHLKMPSEASFSSIFPYTRVNVEMEDFQKGVPNIFQDLCSMNTFSWSDPCYAQPKKNSSYDGSNVLNYTLGAQNYHIEQDNNNPESKPYLVDYKSCSNEIAPTVCNHSTEKLFRDILTKGADEEDVMYLKKGFYHLLSDDKEKEWAQQLQWVSHQATPNNAVSPPKFTDASGSISLNKSGCARSEEYMKGVKKNSKMQAKFEHQKAVSAVNTNSVFSYNKKYKGSKQTLSRDARNNQRRLSTAYQNISHSNLLKLNELKFRKKKLKIGKSEIHGLGVFASEPISANEIIIEYVGQIIRPIIADVREKGYIQSGFGYYCFKVDSNIIIDATKYGNINRYINHSCNPNSFVKILLINNKKKIVFFSKRDIKVDEEITFDYKMKIEDDKIKCLCKDPGCKKSLN